MREYETSVEDGSDREISSESERRMKMNLDDNPHLVGLGGPSS